jgi:hypothetical protein
VIEATAKLHRRVRPDELLVDEKRTALLLDRRREHFLTLCVEAAIQEGAAERSRQLAERAMRGQRFRFLGIVVEMRGDGFAVELVMVVAFDAECGAI